MLELYPAIVKHLFQNSIIQETPSKFYIDLIHLITLLIKFAVPKNIFTTKRFYLHSFFSHYYTSK